MTLTSVHGQLAERLRVEPRRVVVIDDDPTGTQTVSAVDVILKPDPRSFTEFFEGAARSVYVLSNSRAMRRTSAARHVGVIHEAVRSAALAAGEAVAIILRGDSTMRGHVFAEVDAISTSDAVVLLAPAFPEAGRVTVDGIQWLDTPGIGRIPVCETEFARDVSFGYRSRTLRDWVSEVGGGRSSIVVPLQAIRMSGPRALADALLKSDAGTVVIAEAERRSDLEIAALGLLDAEAAGRHVVVRSASTFAAVRAGLVGRSVRSVDVPRPGRVLVVCGSHTAASSDQLERLSHATGATCVEIPARSTIGGPSEIPGTVRGLAERLTADLEGQGFAILATQRTTELATAPVSLGEWLMDLLVQTVASVRGSTDGVIAKGGITAAEVTRRAFGSSRARVVGQLATGVALWDVHVDDGRLIPCAIVPGNVGRSDSLIEIAQTFGVRL
jgi:uncharacterized protein YgbK (DUF1537 family)